MNYLSFTARASFNAVVILDCLSEDETTGLHLHDNLRDLNLPEDEFHVSRIGVVDMDHLVFLLEELERRCREYNVHPILHFEAHGSKLGFTIEHGKAPQSVEWKTLAPFLRRVNIASSFNLGVYFAACEGIHAISPVTIKEAAPFQYLIGPKEIVSAGLVEETALRFYRELLATGNITHSFDAATKGHPFTLFLAEQMLAISYGRVLKMQSIGENRKKRVDELVTMAINNGANPQAIKELRAMARIFSRPDVERFETIQRRFLPKGIGFTFEQLVDFLRAGPNGSSVLPYA